MSCNLESSNVAIRDDVAAVVLEMSEALQLAWMFMDRLAILRRNASGEDILRALWSEELTDAAMSVKRAMIAAKRVTR